MQRSNTSKQNTASTSLTHQFTHHWLPGLLASTQKAQPSPLLPAPPLANQTRVPIAWLDFPFQQQAHHNLHQIAAGSSFSQWGRVVEGGHIILQRKRINKALGLTGEISGCLRSKQICRKISSRKLRAFLTSFSFSRGVFSAHKTKADVFSSLLFASNFYLLREPFHRWAYNIKQRAQKGLR